ncbi:MAG: carbon-nitrogen hydrolase family protein [Elusimicrobia bacterium]|nr:carbon-nitrogen hydrolase family protein [Elusimicrobiota bacterium]
MDRLPLFVEPVPLDLAWKDPGANLDAMEAEIRRRLAAAPEVPPESVLFLFPEMTLTGFVTKDPHAYAVEPPAPPVAALRALARRLRTGIAAGFPEVNREDRRKPLNTLAVVAPDGEIAGLYRKTHLFTWGAEPESACYAAGESGTLFDYRGWKVGLAICFDVRFSALFHAYAKAGADLVLVSSNWVGGPHKTYQYRTLCSAHAILTQAFVAAVNRAGRDPAWEYDGSSYVFAPTGEDIYKGSPCRLDPAVIAAVRKMAVRVADRPITVSDFR